jgi:N-acetylneuraminic acid mutarotase
MKYLILFTILFFSENAFAQNNVGIGTTTPHPSAALEIKDSAKGFLMPRMSTIKRDAIASPAIGLTIINTDDNCIDVFNGGSWSKNCGWRIDGLDTLPANVWVRRNDFPGPGRYGAVSFVLNGKGYVATGYDSVNNKYLKDLWEFDPATYNWTQKANFPGTARKNAVAFTIGTKAYISTGIDSAGALYKDLYEYEPANNLWVQKANFMGSARQDAAAFTVGNFGYICTGLDTNFNDDLYKYDPINNTWQQMANINNNTSGFGIARFAKGSTMNGNNTAFFFGGTYNFNYNTPLSFQNPWNGIVRYNAATNTWTALGSIGSYNTIDISSFAIGSKKYFVNGFDLYTPYNTFFSIDTNSIVPGFSNMITAPNYNGNKTIDGIAFSIGSKGFVLSGRYTSGKEFYEYTTQAGSTIPSYNNSSPAPMNSIASDGNWKKIGNDIYNSNSGNLLLSGQNSSNVGIGGEVLKSPQNGATYKLSVINDGYAGMKLKSKISYTSLDIDAANGDAALRFANNNNFRWLVRNSSADDFEIWDYDGVPGGFSANRLFIKNNTGEIGIGTMSPTEALDVNGDIKADTAKINELKIPTNASAGKVLTSDATGNATWQNLPTPTSETDPQVSSATTNQVPIWNGTTLTDGIITDNGTNVGIGNTSPTSKLNVNGQVTIDQKNFGGYGGLLIKGNEPGSNYPNICFSVNNKSNADVVAGYIGGSITNDSVGKESMNLSFLTSTTGLGGLGERLTIKDNGNIGIGNASPNAPLSFANVTSNKKIALFDVGNNNEFYGLGVNNNIFRYQVPAIIDNHVFYAGVNATTSNELFRIQGDGKVGIGTNAPSATLEVQSTLNPSLMISNTTAIDYGRMRIRSGNTSNRFWDIAANNSGATAGDDLLHIYHPNAGNVISLKSNGAVGVSGNYGTSGQVLTSNGISAAASYAFPVMLGTFVPGGVSNINSTSYQDLVSSQHTITVPPGQNVMALYSYNGSYQPNGCTGLGCDAVMVVGINIDGVDQTFMNDISVTETTPNWTRTQFNIANHTLLFGPGTHTVKLRVRLWNAATNSVTWFTTSSSLIAIAK